MDLEADISQLEAPTFTTINRGPPEPMLRLNWNHKVNLIGEKVLNPMIHSCDKCSKPILIYGRMIPCKHVFCLTCGKQEQKQCPRCQDKVSRVEQTGLGTVFMCTHGGTRYGSTGCKRTYLSQRDLQAHINHRHISSVAQPPVEVIEPEKQMARLKANDPRGAISVSTNIRQRQNSIPAGGLRTNLITVPIQDSPPVVHENPGQSQAYYNQYQQNQAYGQSLPPMHIPPPQQNQYYPPQAYTTQAYSPYTNSAPIHSTQYNAAPISQTRGGSQYDYSAAPPQWPANQQYYR